jgi:hypothetical protein
VARHQGEGALAKDKKNKKGSAHEHTSGPVDGTIDRAVQKAKKAALEVATSPAVAEVVAAALVAAAAALKNPDKARAMAAAASDELEQASANASKRGQAMWQLALDVARRSIDNLGEPIAAAQQAMAPTEAKPVKAPKKAAKKKKKKAAK